MEHSNADELPCLPLATSGTQPDHVAHPFNIGLILSLPDVQKATYSDRVLSKAYCYAQNGLPGSVSADLQPFKSNRGQLGLESSGDLEPSCQTSISHPTILTHGTPRNHTVISGRMA